MRNLEVLKVAEYSSTEHESAQAFALLSYYEFRKVAEHLNTMKPSARVFNHFFFCTLERLSARK